MGIQRESAMVAIIAALVTAVIALVIGGVHSSTQSERTTKIEQQVAQISAQLKETHIQIAELTTLIQANAIKNQRQDDQISQLIQAIDSLRVVVVHISGGATIP